MLVQIWVEVDVQDDLAFGAGRDVQSKLDGSHWCRWLYWLCGTVTQGSGITIVWQHGVSFRVWHGGLRHGWRRRAFAFPWLDDDDAFVVGGDILLRVAVVWVVLTNGDGRVDEGWRSFAGTVADWTAGLGVVWDCRLGLGLRLCGLGSGEGFRYRGSGHVDGNGNDAGYGVARVWYGIAVVRRRRRMKDEDEDTGRRKTEESERSPVWWAKRQDRTNWGKTRKGDLACTSTSAYDPRKGKAVWT
jgi:hypothetical protein